jgi:hypothetical protein
VIGSVLGPLNVIHERVNRYLHIAWHRNGQSVCFNVPRLMLFLFRFCQAVRSCQCAAWQPYS